MKYFLYLLVSLLIASNAMAGALSEEEAMEFIEKVDLAFINRNPEALGSTLSDNATLMGTTTVSGDVSNYSVSKEQYLSSVIGAWRNYSSYDYTKESSKIRSITGNRAIVYEVVVETFELGGTNYEVRSTNKVFLEKEKEAIKVTKIITNSTVTKK